MDVDTPSDSLIGKTIADRYLVLSELGSGGFGAVYMGKHVELKSPVALKVLHGHLTKEQENVARFKREATATSRLRHGAIASVFDVGLLDDGRPFMVMEYLAGKSLANVLREEGALPLERVLPLFIECCDGLRCAHRLGLLHRDVKPDNIFVVRDIDGIEHAKLLDFGLAKIIYGDDGRQLSGLTDTGTVLGTPWYMSPEQCQALPLDARSDLYSLAYSLYEVIAGRRAFGGNTAYQIMHSHLHDPVPPLISEAGEPLVPEQLERAIIRALSKAPNDRYSTIEEFKQALLGVMPSITASVAGTDSPQVVRAAVATAMPASPVAVAASRKPVTIASSPAATRQTGFAKPAEKGNRRPLIVVAALVSLACVVAGVGIWSRQAFQSKAPVALTTSGSANDSITRTPLTGDPNTTSVSPAPDALQPNSQVQDQWQRETGPDAGQRNAPQQQMEPAPAGSGLPSDEQRREEEKRIRELEEKTKSLQVKLQEQQKQQQQQEQQMQQAQLQRQAVQRQQQAQQRPAVEGFTQWPAESPPAIRSYIPANSGEAQYAPRQAGQPGGGGYGNGEARGGQSQPAELPPGLKYGNPPPGWRPGDPLQPGEVPPGWRPGDPLPPGYHLPSGYQQPQ